MQADKKDVIMLMKKVGEGGENRSDKNHTMCNGVERYAQLSLG